MTTPIPEPHRPGTAYVESAGSCPTLTGHCLETRGLPLPGLSPQIVLLILFLVMSSAVDALFTLLQLERGASEANPLMAMALDQGINSFVGLKMSLTALGAILLALNRNSRLVVKSLQILALVYGGLLIYHLLLFMTSS